MDKKYTSLEHAIRNIVTETVGVTGKSEPEGTPRSFLKPIGVISPSKGAEHPGTKKTDVVLTQRGEDKVQHSLKKEEQNYNVKKIIREFLETLPGQESKYKKSLETRPSYRKNLKVKPEKVDPKKRVAPSKIEKKPAKIQNITDKLKKAAEARVAAEKAAAIAAEKSAEKLAAPAATALSKAAPYAADALKFAGRVGGAVGFVLDPIVNATPVNPDESPNIIPTKQDLEKLGKPGSAKDLEKAPKQSTKTSQRFSLFGWDVFSKQPSNTTKADSKGTSDLAGMTKIPMPRADVKGTKDLAGMTKIPMPRADVKGTSDLAGMANVPAARADVKGTKDLAGMTKIPMPRADVKGTKDLAGMPSGNLPSAPTKPGAGAGIQSYPYDIGQAETQTQELLKTQQLPSAKSGVSTATTAATSTSPAGTPAGTPAPDSSGKTDTPSSTTTTANVTGKPPSTTTTVVTPPIIPPANNKSKEENDKKRFKFKFKLPTINPQTLSGLSGNVSGKPYTHYEPQGFMDSYDPDIARKNIENVARPGGKTRIGKQAELRAKIIDETTKRAAVVKKTVKDSTIIKNPKLKHPELDEN